MPGNPHKPTNPDNPVGQARRVQGAQTAWRRHIRPIRKWLLETLQDMQKQVINATSGGVVVNRYSYLIDPQELQRIVDELTRRIEGDVPVQALNQRVRAAYEQGTGDQVENLIAITDGEYTREVTQVLASDSWLRRIALIQSRVFEEMKGFQGETASELARVLSNGVENGLNPRDVARDIRDRFDVSQSSADRIARTEIPGAYRRARWDEDDDANQRLGIRTALLWFSALSPTTRETHARKHGETYDQEHVREFYSRDGNGINCLCSQSSVLVDEDGQPVNKKFVQEVRSRKK